MINLKEHANLLKSCVDIENEKDENWKWDIKSLGKNIVHIGWGYLDYCGGHDGKKTFTITAETCDALGDTLIARHPHGEMIDSIVVGGRYADVQTIESGIKNIILAIATCAHSQY